ncbi:tetratricopeptide repeat protein [uncultured Bacteroides sp.]|uniref:tetratricopeptide repeat protein n=1 Tax=uncultured Bacteroides sp. TaxID=162156 RepID=UPI00261F414C|nr:tetratricopeptide repeat protein [uncultured Bacteroides sp.]
MQKNHQPTQAMALYFDILKETKDPYILSRTYYNLGSIYMWDRVFDKAIDAYTHSYQQDSLLCDTLHMIRILKNMGNIRLHTSDSIESQRLYARALHLAKQRNDSTALAEIYRQHGWNFHKKNNFDSAAYYTRLSMNYSQSPSKLYSTLAEIHRHRQDIDSARYYLNLGINAPDTEDRHACLFFSSQLEHHLSNDQTAYEQLLTYTLMADTLYAQQKNTRN